jgi:hypothetical protein
MDITFTQRRINIYDLVSPIDQSIKGKTFIDCEFIGPANIFIIQSRTGEVFFNGVTFALTYLCKYRDIGKMPLGNFVIFEDCQLVRGTIFKAFIFIPEKECDVVMKQLPTVQWLN